jgi:S1-C subfamily serine protease
VRICVRSIAVGVAALGIGLAPIDWAHSAGKEGLPRPVLPRGDLGLEERATIDLFERSRDSVVFITTSSRVQDFWSRNVFSVPRGTGSGFIWDEAGHIVTNFLQGLPIKSSMRLHFLMNGIFHSCEQKRR